MRVWRNYIIKKLLDKILCVAFATNHDFFKLDYSFENIAHNVLFFLNLNGIKIKLIRIKCFLNKYIAIVGKINSGN